MNDRASRFARGEGRRIGVSFEFFPPASEEMDKILWESIERLAPLAPKFVSVTYGAGGSTRERTHATVKRILAETPLTPAAHLTCVAATREEIDAIVRQDKVTFRAFFAVLGLVATVYGVAVYEYSKAHPQG